MRRVLPCVVLAFSLASPARADETVATLAAPTPVDARAGRLVWSERVPGTERFRLMTRVGDGAAAQVGVPERHGAFDVDLGPGPILKPRLVRGAVVYALSRYGAAGKRFLHVALPGGRTREAISRQGIVAAEFDAGHFLYVLSSFPPDEGCGDATCTLALSDPVAFR